MFWLFRVGTCLPRRFVPVPFATRAWSSDLRAPRRSVQETNLKIGRGRGSHLQQPLVLESQEFSAVFSTKPICQAGVYPQVVRGGKHQVQGLVWERSFKKAKRECKVVRVQMTKEKATFLHPGSWCGGKTGSQNSAHALKPHSGPVAPSFRV